MMRLPIVTLILALASNIAFGASFNETVTFFKDFRFNLSSDSTAGAITALSTSGKNFISLTGASPVLQGISDFAPSKILVVQNSSGTTLSIANNSPSAASTTRRILTGTGASVTIQNDGTATFIYDSGISRWKMIAAGAPSVTVPASPGVVTTNGSALSSTAYGAGNTLLGVVSAGSATEFKSLSTGTSGTDFAISHGVGTITFNLPDASGSARGVITTGGQNISGAKTFTSGVTISSATNQLVLSGPSRTGTINIVQPATSSRTYTVQDPSADANFIMSESAQTKNGILTLATGLTVSAKLVDDAATITSAAGTTTLTSTSKPLQIVTGSSTQIVALPAATALTLGQKFIIENRSSSSTVGAVVVTLNNGTTALTSLSANAKVEFHCVDTSTDAAGSWSWVNTGEHITLGTLSTDQSGSTSSGSPTTATSGSIPAGDFLLIGTAYVSAQATATTSATAAGVFTTLLTITDNGNGVLSASRGAPSVVNSSYSGVGGNSAGVGHYYTNNVFYRATNTTTSAVTYKLRFAPLTLDGNGGTISYSACTAEGTVIPGVLRAIRLK